MPLPTKLIEIACEDVPFLYACAAGQFAEATAMVKQQPVDALKVAFQVVATFIKRGPESMQQDSFALIDAIENAGLETFHDKELSMVLSLFSADESMMPLLSAINAISQRTMKQARKAALV